MGDTWITDMSHFDYKDEEAHELPKEAKKLAEYFGSIIEATVDRVSPFRKSTGLQCRRRPGRIPCSGVIHSELHPDETELRWWCPVCGDNGRISNWSGTRWDPLNRQNYLLQSGRLFETQTINDGTVDDEYKNIQGIIKWDEASDGELPQIMTKKKVYNWNELGRQLMIYEGMHIKITIG